MKKKEKNIFFKILKKYKDISINLKKKIDIILKTKKIFYLKWFFKTTVTFIIGIHLLFILIMFFLIMTYKFTNPPISSLMIYRNIVYKQKNQNIIFIPLKWITIKAQNMFIMAEDYKFYKHAGIDLEAIKRAYTINKQYNLKLFGGSTITQQLARTLFLIPKKTYLRKYMEVIIAFEMELLLGKKRILELYLNYIELGNGIYGIGRASWYYYNKSFYKLDYDEIAKLVAILPSPLRYNPNNFYLNQHLLARYNFLISRIN
jgi:monofunctional biosynthetic peptidoglycan transglycosylase